MKKSDLKTGMRVTLRNGGEYIVLLNSTHEYRDILAGLAVGGFERLDHYNDDLVRKDGRGEWEIERIEATIYPQDTVTDRVDNWETIYKRPPKK